MLLHLPSSMFRIKDTIAPLDGGGGVNTRMPLRRVMRNGSRFVTVQVSRSSLVIIPPIRYEQVKQLLETLEIVSSEIIRLLDCHGDQTYCFPKTVRQHVCCLPPWFVTDVLVQWVNVELDLPVKTCGYSDQQTRLVAIVGVDDRLKMYHIL